MTPQHAQRNETLFIAGDEISRVILVCSGLVGLSDYVEQNRSHIFALCGPGRLLGVESLFQKPARLNAMAIVPSRFCTLSTEGLRRLLRASPTFSFGFLSYMQRELESTYERISAMAHYSTEKRVIALLCELTCDRTDTGCHVRRDTLDFDLNQSQIAELLGATRESVCKVFTSLQRQGLIQVNSQKVRLLEPDRLFSLIKELVR